MSTNLTGLFGASDPHAETARKMGLRHPLEALLCAPARYEDYREVVNDFRTIGATEEDSPIVYTVRVQANPKGYPSIRAFRSDKSQVMFGDDFSKVSWPVLKQIFRLEIDVLDAYQNHAIQTFFRGASEFKQLTAHQQLSFRGNARRFGKKLYFQNSTPVTPSMLGFIKPIYLGLQGKAVNSGEVHALIDWMMADEDRLLQACQSAYDVVREDCGNLSDADILQICTPKNSVIAPTTLQELFTSLHAPVLSVAEGESALEIVSKICALGLQCRAQRENIRAPCPSAPIAPEQDLIQRADSVIRHIQNLKGYSLTNNQVEVIHSVLKRLQSDVPLNGLLSGEVGAGKTMAYAIPAVMAHEVGARVAILAPTELLANQIASVLSKDFGPGISVERVVAGRAIKDPDAILVSTIGLNTSAKKIGYQPNFLISDEQHKLATSARESMMGPHTHCLDVSATPIPRSLALSLYEGMDLFTLNEQPVQKVIHTALIDTRERALATKSLRAALESGERVAVVYTLVDAAEGTPEASIDEPKKKSLNAADKETEEQARMSAVETAELFSEAFPNKVVLLHGKMTSTEKISALDSFRSGAKPLMVTTTIFETGIDVPDVSVIVVRDPQYLGLSQLHQLRGRLARNGGKGTCFLLVEDLDALSEETYQRLKTFCETTDGYSLAYADMMFRGAGDLDGLQQKGRASTTFKSVKMTTHDLLLNDRANLKVEAQASEQITPDPVRQTQRQLFG